ncbi:hypothetical protein BDV12DRAFT_203518 [Aspergillus spectabilis]
MRFQVTWLLTALGAMATSASATENSILEVDLAFPQNKTYAPTESFPIVFAFQNPARARHLNFGIIYHLEPLDNQTNRTSRSHDLRFANWSSHDRLNWDLVWQSCPEEGFESREVVSETISNSTSFSIWFIVQDTADSVDVDLVSATSETSCPDPGFDTAIALNVTDTMNVPTWVNWSGAQYTNDTCAVVSPTPTTPDPCKVEIVRTVVESMEASLKARHCRWVDPPDDCPDNDENSAQSQQRALLGLSGLFVLTLSGALGFFSVI